MLKGQLEVLDQLQRGVTIQALEGRELSHIPMKAEWASVSAMQRDGSLALGPGSERVVEAMRKAVVCTANSAGERRLRSGAVELVLNLPESLRGEGENDEELLQGIVESELEAMSRVGVDVPHPEEANP